MMKQITSYDKVSPLIMKYFKRGVITNNFLTKDDYVSEIAEGRLFYDSSDDFLNVFVKRDNFFYLYFHTLDNKAVFNSAELPLICDVVTECKELMETNEFSEMISRIKLEIDSTDFIYPCSILRAGEDDADDVFQLMKESFDPMTGYVPCYTQIKRECEKGLIFISKDRNEISGVLRTGKTGNTSIIKHLCVNEKYRGKGIAKSLCSQLLIESKKCSVWTGKDNQAAISLYKSLGFTNSPTTSVVYKKG